MATSVDFIDFVCDQIRDVGEIRYRKMFGEYMVYVNDKPVLLVCDNTVYIKKLECVETKMSNAECGYPYDGAKEHFILDIDDSILCKEIVKILEEVIPIPKPRKKKNKKA